MTEKAAPPLPVPTQQRPPQRHSMTAIALVVAFYWACSLAVVFLNKHILSSSEYPFPYPLFVTWFQLLVALVLLAVLGRLGTSYSVFSMVPPFEYRSDVAWSIAPLTAIYILMLAFNNLCLKYVEVTFYQVARSLTILFNIILTYYMLGSKTSRAALLSCAIVFVGFIFGSMGEINFSWLGIFYGVGSSLFVALYGIYVKRTLAAVDNNQWRLLHYNTTNALFMLAPLVLLSGEMSFLYEVHFLGEFNFWLVMIVTGITGFLINIAIFLQIKYTTPLTNTISGTAKACFQTGLAWVIWQNEITSMNGFGIILSLFGSGLYSYVRYKEMR